MQMERVKSSDQVLLYTKLPGEGGVPPVFGKVRWVNEALEFLPRFPLQAGIPYFVTLRREIIRTGGNPSDFGNSSFRYTFIIPKKEMKPVATVNAVFPSSSELPENLLKFYLHFSHPMSGGDAYSHIRLLNQNGDVIDLPFLELGEELWDWENRRLTLLFDPGRIKSGLMPRREEGAVLEEGKRYTLQILDTWKDGEGRPLLEIFEKRFLAVEADGDSPQVDQWQLRIPKPNTTQPFRIDFPESLDEALLQRVIQIVHSGGQLVEGTIAVENNERRWLYTPTAPWVMGSYQIRVGTILEDLAGNSVGRPFEIDLEESEHRRPEPFAYRRFRIE